MWDFYLAGSEACRFAYRRQHGVPDPDRQTPGCRAAAPATTSSVARGGAAPAGEAGGGSAPPDRVRLIQNSDNCRAPVGLAERARTNRSLRKTIGFSRGSRVCAPRSRTAGRSSKRKARTPPCAAPIATRNPCRRASTAPASQRVLELVGDSGRSSHSRKMLAQFQRQPQGHIAGLARARRIGAAEDFFDLVVVDRRARWARSTPRPARRPPPIAGDRLQPALRRRRARLHAPGEVAVQRRHRQIDLGQTLRPHLGASRSRSRTTRFDLVTMPTGWLVLRESTSSTERVTRYCRSIG